MPVPHLADVSGGAASAVMLIRLIERFGDGAVLARFADVQAEEPDLYRFLDDLERYLGIQILRIKQPLDTWQTFEQRGMWTEPSGGGCMASYHLKKIPLRLHAESVGNPETTTIYVGFDVSEPDRMARLQKNAAPWRFEFPLTWEPRLLRCDIHDELRRRGLKPPSMYDQGYPHANCAGACVLAGIGQWRALLKDYPGRYAAAEAHEVRMMTKMETAGRAVHSILRDRRGGKTQNLTLRQLREEDESDARPADSRWGETACSCIGDLFS